MSNYTPGPWDFQPMRVNCGCISTAVVFRPARKTDFSDSEPIGQLVSDYGLETVNANARLIAAAPDMLNALEAAAHVLPLGEEYDAVVEAVAKAKGETE